MSNSLIAELEDAVKHASPEKRVNTLRRVTDLFLGESDRLNEHQIRVFDDVLVHLIQRIETKALVQLSTSLAPVGNAPIEVIRQLSRDGEITIAGPVLSKSKRLSENDLVDIAKANGSGHLLAISERDSLSETVTDVLVERGDTHVHHALASNAGAHFSEVGFATLVSSSASDEKLAEKLGLRLDIPEQLLRQLLSRATELVRTKLLAATTPENQKKVQRALASIANEIGREATPSRNFEGAESEVHELNRHGKLTEAALVGFIVGRKHEEMVATLALFCGIRADLIERLIKNVRHEGLVVACKAAKLNWPTVALILKNRLAHHVLSEGELQTARSAFIQLSQAAAQRSMRFMQVHEATRKPSDASRVHSAARAN